MTKCDVKILVFGKVAAKDWDTCCEIAAEVFGKQDKNLEGWYDTGCIPPDEMDKPSIAEYLSTGKPVSIEIANAMATKILRKLVRSVKNIHKKRIMVAIDFI